MSRAFNKEGYEKRTDYSDYAISKRPGYQHANFKKNWKRTSDSYFIVRRAYARLNRELDLLIEIDDMKDIMAEKRPGGAEYSRPGLTKWNRDE